MTVWISTTTPIPHTNIEKSGSVKGNLPPIVVGIGLSNF